MISSLIICFLGQKVLGGAEPATLPPLVPAVHSYEPFAGDSFQLPRSLQVIVDRDVAHSTKDNGLTLIPPTLLSFAETFASDVRELFPGTSVGLSLGSSQGLQNIKGSVFLTLSQSGFTHADGSPTTEGYQMAVSSSNIKISGAGTKGAFWATRTLLQGLVLGQGSFPSGVISDQPDWQTRGFMLDVGRQWYPISFLKDICTYASWYKISEFHIHLSDNVPPQGNFDAYARFRLRPDNPALAGLTPHVNETYSKSEFEDLQTTCAARGVTVISELESPGHALAITQWKPELALSSDPSLINLTVPDAIPTIKSIWKEFLPWMHSKQVSIGADEYASSLADDYNNFVNTMSDFIGEADKSIRIWGTNEPSNKTSVSKKIAVQHWDFSQDDPEALIRQGYNVINSEDSVLYIVMKQSGSFPQQLNQSRLWDGANVNTGGIWDPHVFDRGNESNNPSIIDPLLKGSIMAAWNDHGPTASTYLEAFYAIREGLPVVAAASWQAASRPNHLTHEQFLSAYPVLEATAPGQNLDRRIPSKGKVIVSYDLTKTRDSSVPDQSGNGYHATVKDGVLVTPLGSKGQNYTLLIVLSSAQVSGRLLSGPDNSFGFVSSDGGNTLAFTSSNITYPLLDYLLPVEAKTSTREIILTGTDRTSVWVDGTYAGDFLVAIDGTSVLVPMAFVAPLQNIGGSESKVEKFVLWEGLQEEMSGLS